MKTGARVADMAVDPARPRSAYGVPHLLKDTGRSVGRGMPRSSRALPTTARPSSVRRTARITLYRAARVQPRTERTGGTRSCHAGRHVELCIRRLTGNFNTVSV